MKHPRSRILATAAALVSLSVAAVAVSCTGPRTEKAQPRDKTTGPAVAKGDKTMAKPGQPTAGTGGATAAAPDTSKPPVKPTTTPPADTSKPTASKPGTAPTASGTEKGVVPPLPGAPLPPPTTARPERSTQPTADTPTVKQPKDPIKPDTTKPVVKQPDPVKPDTTKPVVKQPDPTGPDSAKPEKPVVKQPATDKPTVKQPTDEASKLLMELQENLRIERQKNAILVEDYIEHSAKAARAARWEEAAEWATKALDLDHNNDRAEALLRQSRSALGFRDAEIGSLSDMLAAQKRVQRQQAHFSAQQYWNTAMKAKASGNFAESLRNLELAKTVIQNDPSGVNWGDMAKDVDVEIGAVSKLKASADKASRAAAARQAYSDIREEEQKVRAADAQKRAKLLESAMAAFQASQYETAEGLFAQYLKLNPGDTNARLLMNDANRAKHGRAAEATLKLARERIQEWRQDMRETTIPYHDILKWPSVEHWTRITELRRAAGEVTRTEPENEDSLATKNRLRTERTGFDFTAAQYTDVIKFIQSTRNFDIVIDPEVQGDVDAVLVTLKLVDTPVANALEVLNRIAGGLIYIVDGSVIMITKADSEKARGKPIVKVHAVGDLAVPLTNFIAPNLQLLPSGAEEDEESPRFGASQEGVASFGTVDDLMALVQSNVANEDYWSSDGVSVATSGTDKMVVIAEPKVQEEVAKFLNDLRGFAGIVVTIETRFLTVTDNFLQDIGVDIRGLGNGSPGRLALLDDVTNGLINNASAGFDNNGIGLPANASGRPSAGAFFNNNSDGDFRTRSENVFDRALGASITNVGGALFQYTLVDDTDLSLIMQAVEKTQQGRVLQAPSVTVYNTQRANITLINQLTFIQDFDVEVAQTAFIADPIIGIIQDGLVLDVQPTVSHDRKYITMQLKPTIATLVRPIPTFTTSLGAFTTPVTIQIPELKVERAATTVRVPDGGTLLLGGLKNISLNDLKSETPWFSSIPFASFFFGRHGTSQEMDNLMVIVKATITDLQEQAEAYGGR